MSPLTPGTDDSEKLPKRPLLRALESIAFALARVAVRMLPLAAVPAVGGLLGSLGFWLDRRHRRVALENLSLALPDMDDAERRRVAKASFRSLGTSLLTALAVARLDAAAMLELCDLEGGEHLEAAKADGRGVLMMNAHFGQWEIAGQYLALRGWPMVFIGRPMDNPWIDRWLTRFRERFGNRLIPKRGGTRPMFETLRDRGRVGMLIDQRVHPNEGKAYRFFGHPAYTTPLLADLSIRTGAPVVPFFGYPADGGRRVRVVVRPPIRPLERGDRAVETLTLRYLKELEEVIGADPELWLWAHRRWRKTPTTEFKKRIPRHAAGPDSDEVIG